MRTEIPCALFVSNYFIEIQRLIFHGPETSKTMQTGNFMKERTGRKRLIITGV